MSRNNILFIVTSLNQGGLETYLLRFLRYAELDNVTVMCKSGITGDLYEEYVNEGVHIKPFKLGYFNLFSFYRFYKYLKQNNYTTVCDFTGNFAGVPLWVSSIVGINKRISFYRGSEDRFTRTISKQIYNRFMKFLTNKYATKILSNSQAALDYFYPGVNKNNSRFDVIYNGIDLEDNWASSDSELLRNELNIPAKAFVIGHTGRFSYAKNHSTIISVAIDLCSKYQDIYFVLVGRNVDIEYREKIFEQGLQNQILLLGYRKDVPKLLNLFDLFFFPSITEGQPNSLIEAMVFGLPIVASDILPIQESVPNEYISKLVPVNNPTLFMSRIEDLYLNRSLLDENIHKNWAVKNFDAKKLFSKFKKEL